MSKGMDQAAMHCWPALPPSLHPRRLRSPPSLCLPDLVIVRRDDGRYILSRDDAHALDAHLQTLVPRERANEV